MPARDDRGKRKARSEEGGEESVIELVERGEVVKQEACDQTTWEGGREGTRAWQKRRCWYWRRRGTIGWRRRDLVGGKEREGREECLVSSSLADT